MKYFIALGVLAAFVLGGLLGLTAGVNLNPNVTVSFVPNWGSLGDWVSGVGALLAVRQTDLKLMLRIGAI